MSQPGEALRAQQLHYVSPRVERHGLNGKRSPSVVSATAPLAQVETQEREGARQGSNRMDSAIKLMLALKEEPELLLIIFFFFFFKFSHFYLSLFQVPGSP